MEPIIQQPKESDLGKSSVESLSVATSNNLPDKNNHQTILDLKDVKINKKNTFGATINTLLILVCILLPFVGWGIGSLMNPQGIESHSPATVLLYIAYFPAIIITQPLLLIPLAVGLAVIIILFRKQVGNIVINILLLLAVLVAAVTCHGIATAPTQEEG